VDPTEFSKAGKLLICFLSEGDMLWVILEGSGLTTKLSLSFDKFSVLLFVYCGHGLDLLHGLDVHISDLLLDKHFFGWLRLGCFWLEY
jgi:hypothetical protein